MAWNSCPHAWMFAGVCGAETIYTSETIHTIKAQWAQVKSDERLQIWDSGSYACGYDIARANDIKANSEEQYLTIFTGAYADFSAMVASPSKRSLFISDIQSFLTTTGWTGAEIDFENFWSWTTTDFNNYVTFLTELGNALHASGGKLGVAVVAKPKYSYLTTYDYSVLDGLPVDFWSLMLYDNMWGFVAGEYAPITDPMWAILSLQNFRENVTTGEIVAGIANYGYYSPCGSTVSNPTFFAAADASSLPGYNTGSYDEVSGEYKWTDGTNCYWYSDGNTMNLRRNMYENLGVKAVSVWSIRTGADWFTGDERSDCLNLPELNFPRGVTMRNII